MNSSKVLLLSDRPEALAWREAFVQRGMKVIATSAPATVRSYWVTEPPLLTVIDLTQPFEETLAICRQLRSLASAPMLLILSADNGNKIMEAYHAGVTECLIQPASPAVILLKALAWSMRNTMSVTEPASQSYSWTQLSQATV